MRKKLRIIINRILLKLNYLLIVLLFVGYNSKVSAQMYSSPKFIEYHNFKNHLDQYEDLSLLNKEYDLLLILLLDSSEKKILFEYFPKVEKAFREYAPSLKLSKATVGFVTEEKNLKEVFESVESQERILNSVYGPEFVETIKSKYSYPIYIKENEAIFEMNNSFTTDIYYIRLFEGVVQINWLGGTIE